MSDDWQEADYWIEKEGKPQMTTPNEALARAEILDAFYNWWEEKYRNSSLYLTGNREIACTAWLAAWTAARAGEGEYVRGLEAAAKLADTYSAAVAPGEDAGSSLSALPCAIRALIDAARAEVKP